jgi:hypothetical protein
VDTELPSGGLFADQPVNGVLWVALAEKAYAEANGAGYVTTFDEPDDSYAALQGGAFGSSNLAGGDPSWALQAITGKSADAFAINPSNMAAAWNAGQLIVLSSSPNAGNNLVVGGSEGTHAYAVVNYIASSDSLFELYNPWGESYNVLTNTWGLNPEINSVVPYAGNWVFGGAFYASESLISQDFAWQSIGSGATPGTGALHSGSLGVDGSKTWNALAYNSQSDDASAVADEAAASALRPHSKEALDAFFTEWGDMADAKVAAKRLSVGPARDATFVDLSQIVSEVASSVHRRACLN